MLKYYPAVPDLSKLMREYREYGLSDLAEDQRLEDIVDAKMRGKGTPKKAKTKGAWFRFLSLRIRCGRDDFTDFASFFSVLFNSGLTSCGQEAVVRSLQLICPFFSYLGFVSYLMPVLVRAL